MRFLIILFSAVLLLYYPLSVSGGTISDELLSSIRAENRYNVIEKINRIKETLGRDGGYNTLIYLWVHNKGALKNINWNFVDDELVRINIADALIQASKNNLVTINEMEIYKYAKSLLSVSNVRIKSDALLVVARLEKNEDVILISGFLDSEDLNVFRGALSALVTMCNPRVDNILSSLKKKRVSLDKKESIEDILKLRQGLIDINYCRRSGKKRSD